MTDTLRTIDLPRHLLTPQEHSFDLDPRGEVFPGTFQPWPRSGGPRYMRWTCTLQMNALHDSPERDFRAEWQAFIHGLKGVATAMRIFDPMRRLPKGKAAGFWRGQCGRTEYRRTDGSDDWQFTNGTKLVAGSGFCTVGEAAARNADTIVLSGLMANETVFKPGDLIEIGDANGFHGNLHEVAIEAVSDDDGKAGVILTNRLWKPALAGDLVNLIDPRGRFVLVDNAQGKSRRNMVTAASSFDAVEVPYVE